MAKTKEVHCPCGGTYNEQKICTECGKKQLRSAAYRRWHGFLCAVAVLILTACICTNLCVRDYMRSERLSSGIEDSRISDFTIPTAGKNVAAYINAAFLQERNISDESIEKIINAMKLETLISEKLTAQRKLLDGSADAVVRITNDDILKLINNAESTIEKQARFRLNSDDKDNICTEAAKALRPFNSTMNALYGSTLGRLLARFSVSIWSLILACVLLLLVCWRWMVVRKNSGTPMCGTVKGVGLLLVIPAAVTMICLIVCAVYSLIMQASEIGLHPLGAEVRFPIWLCSAGAMLLGIILLVIAGIMQKAAAKKQAAITAAASAEAEPAPVQSAEELFGHPVTLPANPPIPVMPVPQKTAEPTEEAVTEPLTNAVTELLNEPSPEQPTVPERCCVSCGHPLSQTAAFCKECGTKQPAPET